MTKKPWHSNSNSTERVMEQTYIKDFYNNAMKYGTYLGIFWTVMYILLFKFYSNGSLSMLAMAMLFTSPFLACRFAKDFRKKECGDNLGYAQAWTFLFCMYICATLFSTMVNYIFFNIIDQGAIIMELNDTLSQIIATPNLEAETKVLFEDMQDIISRLTVNDLIWQLLGNNIFSSLTLPPIIAIFARRTL